MKKMRRQKLLVLAGATAGAALGAGVAMAAHQPVTLYTYEEVAAQFGYPKMPVMVNAKGQGLPYSPKQSCGTPEYNQQGQLVSNCHDYGKISDHAFHSNQGVSEIKDLVGGTSMGTDPRTGNTVTLARDGQFNPIRNKPWTQSVGMIGKW